MNSMPSTYLFPANLCYYAAQIFSFFFLKSLPSSKACVQTLNVDVQSDGWMPLIQDPAI